MEVEGAELAAVIAGRDAKDLAVAAGAGGADDGSGRGSERRLSLPVDDELEHRVGPLGELRRDDAAYARSIGQGTRGAEPLVARAELGARTHHAAREGHDDVRQLAHRRDGALGRHEGGGAAAAEDE